MTKLQIYPKQTVFETVKDNYISIEKNNLIANFNVEYIGYERRYLSLAHSSVLWPKSKAWVYAINIGKSNVNIIFFSE